MTGQRFDPEAFRLPGEPIPEAETGNPLAGLDLDAAEAPLYQKPPIADYYRFRASPSGGNAGRFFYLRLPEAGVIRYCRDNDGSPNVLIRSFGFPAGIFFFRHQMNPTSPLQSLLQAAGRPRCAFGRVVDSASPCAGFVQRPEWITALLQ